METETSTNHITANSVQGAVSGSVTSRPILFSTEMVKAILAGRKTQTRRIISERNSESTSKLSQLNFNDVIHDNFFEPAYLKVARKEDSTRHRVFCKYKIGDILWVRETWATHHSFDHYGIADIKSTSLVSESEKYQYVASGLPEWCGKHRPSIFMPREACRIELRITDIKVERLQSISEEDARREGVKYDLALEFNQYLNYEKGIYQCQTAVESFKTLWSEINGEKSWSENPFVWVITFERVELSEHYR